MKIRKTKAFNAPSIYFPKVYESTRFMTGIFAHKFVSSAFSHFDAPSINFPKVVSPPYYISFLNQIGDRRCVVCIALPLYINSIGLAF